KFGEDCAVAWFSRNPMGPRRCRRWHAFDKPNILLDILHLLSQLFDFHLDFYGCLTNRGTSLIQARSLRKRCSYLTIHLLQDKVHAFSCLVFEIFETSKLLQMASQPCEFLGNVGAFCMQKSFRFDSMSAVGNQLRGKFLNARDKLRPIVFDKTVS